MYQDIHQTESFPGVKIPLFRSPGDLDVSGIKNRHGITSCKKATLDEPAHCMVLLKFDSRPLKLPFLESQDKDWRLHLFVTVIA